MTRKLSKMGVESCGDLQKIPLSALQKEFGPKTGQSLYRFCRGEDDRLIRTEKERKSVSAEVNYGIRFQNVRFCLVFHLFACFLKFLFSLSFKYYVVFFCLKDLCHFP